MTLTASAHKELLLNLISLSNPVSELSCRLEEVSRDQPDEVMKINFHHVKSAIERFLKGELTAEEIEGWANLIECREDLGFENQGVEEAIYRLANPVLEGEINESNCLDILASHSSD